MGHLVRGRKPANAKRFAFKANAKISLLLGPIVVTYYIKLFRTETDRHNGILMSFLLLVAETITTLPYNYNLTFLEGSVLCFKNWFHSYDLFLLVSQISLVIKPVLFALRCFCFKGAFSFNTDNRILSEIWNSILFISNLIETFSKFVLNFFLLSFL